MNVIVNPYDLAAVALAPAVAVASLRLRDRWYLTLALVATALIGWGLMISSASWADAQAAARFDAIQNPTPQQLDTFDADGASRASLIIFGLPVSLIYASIWFALVRIARRFAKRVFHA